LVCGVAGVEQPLHDMSTESSNVMWELVCGGEDESGVHCGAEYARPSGVERDLLAALVVSSRDEILLL
jgi:hypothetical protein